MKLLNHLDELALNSRLFLYGAGDGGVNFKRAIEKHRRDIKLVGFLDDYKSGKRDGLNITKINGLNVKQGKQELVLITSAYWRDMQKNLNRLNYNNYLIVNPVLFYDYLIFSREEEKKYALRLEYVKNLFSSVEDRELFGKLIANRQCRMQNNNRVHEYFTNRTFERRNQYLEFLNRAQIKTIIEGGVFDGSNTREFLKLLSGDGFIYGFDPLYDSLSDRVIFKDSSRVRIYPLALWHHRDKLVFKASKDNPEGSQITAETGGSDEIKKVNAISVDEFVKENKIKKIDFIKLDVEGAELQILKGAKITLKRDRPQLAVAIYHKKEDLFEIPIFLSRVLKNYKYRIGHYSSTFWDTVLYAVPKELLN